MADNIQTQTEIQIKKETYPPPSNESLHELEGRYFSLVENAPDIIFTIDLKGKFLFFNKTAQKITGYTISELLNKNLQSIVIPEHQSRISNILENIPNLQIIPPFEAEIISLNGNTIPLGIHIKPIKDSKGKILFLLGIARDNTEEKKALKALKESVNKYSTLIEHAKDGVVIIQDGICKFANKAFVELSAFPLEELIGRSLFEKLEYEEKGILYQKFKEHVTKKELPSILELKMKRKDGAIKDIEISASNIQYEDRPAYMAIIRDITERKLIEKSLRESKEKYKLLVENINDVIFTLDVNGNITYISPALEKYQGFKVDEIIGHNFMQFVHPEDRERLENSLKKTLQGKIEPYEFRVINKNGESRYVLASSRALFEENKLVGILGIITDITERKIGIEKLNKAYKEAEDAKMKLKAIIDNAPNIAIQGYNIRGEVLFLNSFSESLFDIREAEARGKNIKAILSSVKDTLDLPSLLKEVSQTKKSSSLRECSITTKNMETKHILCSIFPIFLPEQEPIIVAMEVDLSERKRAEEKIREMNRQLESFSRISADILSIDNEEELFKKIAQAVVDISDFNRVLIYFFKDEPPYREILGSIGVKEEDLKRVRKINMPKRKYEMYFQKGIKIGNQSVYIPHTLKNILDPEALIPGEKEYPDQEGLWNREDNLLVSMKDAKGELIGIISVDDSKSGKAPTDETVRPLEIFANLISEIIQKRKLAKKIKESQEKYRELISNIKVGVLRITPEGHLLETNPSTLDMFSYEDPESFLKLRMEDLIQNPDHYRAFTEELEIHGIIKNKEIEMKRKDQSTFWASITSSAVKDTTGKRIYYDTVIEDITERKNLVEKVKKLSITDELTGLYNRRYLNEHLPEALKNTSGWKSALSLIMIDIDEFKKFNDTYYHLEGDEILKTMARIILKNIRKDFDWASRFGGEEFVIILPGTTATEAYLVAQRIKREFESIKFRPKGATVQQTISLGISQCIYTQESDKHVKNDKNFHINYEKIANDLINLADNALFEAKKMGKSRIVISQESVTLSRTFSC